MDADVPDELLFELANAGSERLEELLDSWWDRLTPTAIRAVLDNPYSTESTVRRIYRDRRFIALYEVRARLVRHRALPLAFGLQLMPGLFWRDLSAIALETRIRPQLRRAAEMRLVERLPALATGERMNLARRGTPRLIQQLGRDSNPRVCNALMENPRLTEGQILPWISRETAAPQMLRAVARSRRWGVRYPIRVAICRNPRSPVEIVLPLLPLLKRRDQQAVSTDNRLSSVVRRRAELLSG